jgi:hypothetical protein
MDSSKVVLLAPDYFLEKIDGEITVYHPSLTTSLYLNETGALIWELCNGRRTVAEVIDILQDRYPESRAQIPAEVTGIIARLVENNVASLGDA